MQAGEHIGTQVAALAKPAFGLRPVKPGIAAAGKHHHFRALQLDGDGGYLHFVLPAKAFRDGDYEQTIALNEGFQAPPASAR